jgi:translation initiation factor IF-3
LILINGQADPPVCKLVELHKFLYEQQLKQKEAAKAQRAGRTTIKEVQFKPNIDDHDFDVKCRNIAKFIGKGNLVKLQVQFRGRERQHTDLGYNIIDRVLESVENVVIDGKPQFSGNRITAILRGTNGV